MEDIFSDEPHYYTLTSRSRIVRIALNETLLVININDGLSVENTISPACTGVSCSECAFEVRNFTVLDDLENHEVPRDVCARTNIFLHNFHKFVSKTQNLSWDSPSLEKIRSTL